MFLEVRGVLEGNGFVGMLQNTEDGKNWQSSEWDMRFLTLRLCEADDKIDPHLSAFCRELSAGVDRYKAAVGRP